jgi:Family of unknown function (DUF5996)
MTPVDRDPVPPPFTESAAPQARAGSSPTPRRGNDRSTAWPGLRVADWESTRDTLHLWTQVVGKIRLAHTPPINHWWNVTLYPTATGLTTSLIPYGSRGFQINFDFHAHRLDITTTDDARRSVALEPRSVADFYAEVMRHLDELDVTTQIWTVPVEIEGAIPFDDDHDHASYDRDAVERFAQILVHSARVFHEFRARFLGKASPVHFFWGAFDLAVTRFSGRGAPPHPGGAPNCGPHVMLEAYSHEVSSCGYWPGGRDEGLFYSYAYPEPEGVRDAAVAPPAAYDDDLGEFVLPYDAVRAAEEPTRVLLEFLQSTYEAVADRATWNRAELERR